MVSRQEYNLMVKEASPFIRRLVAHPNAKITPKLLEAVVGARDAKAFGPRYVGKPVKTLFRPTKNSLFSRFIKLPSFRR